MSSTGSVPSVRWPPAIGPSALDGPMRRRSVGTVRPRPSPHRGLGAAAAWYPDSLRVVAIAVATARPIHPDRSRTGRGCRVANIKSQIKRNRQNEKRRLRNKAVKSSLKTAIRKFHEAAAAGDAETATALLRAASRKLDKAVSKGVIHKNQAANRKSAIAKKLASLAPDSPGRRRARHRRASREASAARAGRRLPRRMPGRRLRTRADAPADRVDAARSRPAVLRRSVPIRPRLRAVRPPSGSPSFGSHVRRLPVLAAPPRVPRDRPGQRGVRPRTPARRAPPSTHGVHPDPAIRRPPAPRRCRAAGRVARYSARAVGRRPRRPIGRCRGPVASAVAAASGTLAGGRDAGPRSRPPPARPGYRPLGQPRRPAGVPRHRTGVDQLHRRAPARTGQSRPRRPPVDDGEREPQQPGESDRSLRRA